MHEQTESPWNALDDSNGNEEAINRFHAEEANQRQVIRRAIQ